MKIIFSGGGTLGPVTPLLAMHEIIHEAYPEAKFLWIGIPNGPERSLVEEANIPFLSLPTGKLRRYFSFWNVIDLPRLFFGFFRSCVIVWKEQPTLCISAGGYVSPPLHWAAWFFGVPTWVHQQDVQVGLAVRLMAPVAKHITTALTKNVKNFSPRKTIWLGNPIRAAIRSGDKERARRLFALSADLPVVFVIGGGTGSLRLNQLVVEAVESLRGICQIVHLSGRERPQELVRNTLKHFSHYHVYQFFTNEMKDAYAIADMVVSRAGFATIAELSALNKPAILVPKPGHQEQNVRFLEEAGAVELVSEVTADGHYLAKKIKDLLADEDSRLLMGKRLGEILPMARSADILRIIGKYN